MYLPNQVKEGDSPFNMAMLFYFRLNELLSAKDKSVIGGDMPSYYSCLRSIFNNIYFQIKDEKLCEDIKYRLDKVLKILSAPMSSNNSLNLQTQGMNYSESRELLDEIDRDLMVLLDKKKMIFPRIQSNQGLSTTRKKLGLTE